MLKELECRSEAREAQLNSLSLQPLFWGAWSELAILCDSREMVSTGEGGEEGEVILTCDVRGKTPICVNPQLYSLSLPYHWLKDFFLAAASLHLVLLEDAFSYYNNLICVGFGTSSYVTAQLALVNYHKKGIGLVARGLSSVLECNVLPDYSSACGMFTEVRKKDPFRLTDMDVFSNMLFVMVRFMIIGGCSILESHQSAAGAAAGTDPVSTGCGEDRQVSGRDLLCIR